MRPAALASIVVAALVACRGDDKPAPTSSPPPATGSAPAGGSATAAGNATTGDSATAAAPAIDRNALLAGQLPAGAPETDLVNAQCRICHSVDYLTQQRLSEAAWKKTIDKMRTFGAVLTDDQAAALVAFASRYWNPDLPGHTWTLGMPPAGALPAP